MSASVPHRHTGGSRFIMVAAALAAFIATFNETFLNVGFTPIMADLGVTVPTVQWLATAYMLGAAVMTPTAGFFITRFGTKPLFLATTSTLVIGGIVTALAPNFPVLLAGRIIQSIGTGLLVPIGMMIALTVSPKPKIGKYMGIMGSMTTLGPSIAILASGFILELTDSNWRALCWAFTALSALVFVVGAATVYNISESEKARLDYPSLVLVAIGLIGLLYGISTIFGPTKLTAAAAFFVGAVALGLFVKRQGTIANPLINLAPLRVFPFTAGVVINVVALIIVFSMNILVPTHLQSVQGTSGLTASLVLFPAILCAAVFGPIAGNIYDAHGARWLLPMRHDADGHLRAHHRVHHACRRPVDDHPGLHPRDRGFCPDHRPSAVLRAGLAAPPAQPGRRDDLLHQLPDRRLPRYRAVHRNLRRGSCPR